MGWLTVSDTFQVDSELFYMHNRMRWRPIAVRGFVSGPHKKCSRTVSTPLASIGIAGGESDGKIPNTEAGHLIALEFGGLDSSYNLVPMFGEVNRGTYRSYETTLGERISELIKGGKKPAMLVVLSYPPLQIVGAGDYRIPLAMTVYFYNDVSNLSSLQPLGTNLVHVVPNKKSEPARWPIEGTDIELRENLIKIKTNFSKESWKVENVHGDISKGLPPLTERPNAWLDFLVYSKQHYSTANALLSKVPDEIFTIGGYQGFRDSQRLFVALANRFTQPDPRKGECWSDEPDKDPIKSALTSLGTDDGIHVDHIIPCASGGWNVYSNAAVVSSLYNKQKGR